MCRDVAIGPSEIQAAWPLTGVSIQGDIPSYPTRRVFIVVSDQGKFVVKACRASPNHSLDDARLSVLDFLAERNFTHAPALLRTRAGDRATRMGVDVVWMLEYLPRAVDDSDSPPETWRLMGEAAARLNSHSDFELPFAVPLSRVIDELARRAAGQRFEEEYLRLLVRASGVTRLASDALVHGEINYANARRRADGTVVFVDWD